MEHSHHHILYIKCRHIGFTDTLQSNTLWITTNRANIHCTIFAWESGIPLIITFSDVTLSDKNFSNIHSCWLQFISSHRIINNVIKPRYETDCILHKVVGDKVILKVAQTFHKIQITTITVPDLRLLWFLKSKNRDIHLILILLYTIQKMLQVCRLFTLEKTGENICKLSICTIFLQISSFIENHIHIVTSKDHFLGS